MPWISRTHLYPFHEPALDHSLIGLGVLDDYMCPSVAPARPTSYIRPWRSVTARKSGLSTVSTDKDTFKVSLDVQQFRPEEVTVKTVDNHVIVIGKHEERPDEHGFICRSFQRRYLLPKDTDPDAIKSTLSSDGVLSIIAPKLAPQSMACERMIPVVQTHTPAIDSGKPKSVTIGATEANPMDE